MVDAVLNFADVLAAGGNGTFRPIKAMDTPPTITAGTSRTLPRQVDAGSSGTVFLTPSVPLGGYFNHAGTIPATSASMVYASNTVTGGTGGYSSSGLLHTMFSHTGEDLEYIVYGASATHMIKINDEFVSLTPTSNANQTSVYKIAFSSADERRIDIYIWNGRFWGVNMGYTDMLTAAPIRGPRVIIGLDSFSAANVVDHWAAVWLAHLMQWDDVWAAGVGGTGYVATNVGTAKKLRDRIATDFIAFSPDIILLMGSVNDWGQDAATVQSEAELCVRQIKAALRQCLVFAGMNASGGVETMPASALNVMDATRDGITAGGGIWLNPIEMPISFTGDQPVSTVTATMTAGRAGNGGDPLTASTAAGVRIAHVAGSANVPEYGQVLEIGTGATRERILPTSQATGGGYFAANYDGTLQYTHAAGEPVKLVGPSYMTGHGYVGATTGYGNSDTFVTTDGVHPAAAGRIALARVWAHLLTGYGAAARF